MNAKLFNSSCDGTIGFRTYDYCVDGKVHFSRRKGPGMYDHCFDFRQCDGSCKQQEYPVPGNVARLVEHCEKTNFTGERFTAVCSGEIQNIPYAPWKKHVFEEEFDDWDEGWQLVK